MISERCYQTARTEADAIAELGRNAGSQFDPAVVNALCNQLADAATTIEPNPSGHGDVDSVDVILGRDASRQP